MPIQELLPQIVFIQGVLLYGEDLYKNDTKYGIQEEYSDEITEHTGTVECYSNYELKERNISWSRFKDIIKPLSEYVKS